MLEYIAFIIGFGLLIKGANFLVDGSSLLAKKFRVPSLVIGLTIVAFGTSMPEFIVNMISAFSGETDIALGNIVGSNIFNLLLILGIAALFNPLKIQSSTIWKEIPLSLLAALVLFFLANDALIDSLNFSMLTRSDGLIMICFFAIFLAYVIDMALAGSKKEKKQKISESNIKIFGMIILGLIGLYFGGKWVVNGAVIIAEQLKISSYLISLIIVAAGTSLPELVTSLVAAIKKEMDLSVGNIIGSNIFNIFWILGATALITPVSISAIANFDILFLVASTLLLFFFMFIGSKHQLDKWQGILFIILYILYLIYIIFR